MAGLSKAGKKELAKLASENMDVLAFADRNREIVELPEGLETGETKRRKRGARTDRDCIEEICELIAQGITATASVRYVGVPWATWQKWLKTNHEDAAAQYEFAYTSHLEVMADRTLQIYEELKAQRESAMAEFKLDDLAIPVSKSKHISLLACELGEFFLSYLRGTSHQ
jgi:hypothetical protein